MNRETRNAWIVGTLTIAALCVTLVVIRGRVTRTPVEPRRIASAPGATSLLSPPVSPDEAPTSERIPVPYVVDGEGRDGRGPFLTVLVTNSGHPWRGAEIFVAGRAAGASDAGGRLDVPLHEIWTDRAQPWIEVLAVGPQRLARRLVAPIAQTVTLELRPWTAPRARGVVMLEESGNPLADHIVRVDDVSARTGADGRFDLSLPPHHGNRIVVEHDGTRLLDTALLTGTELLLRVPSYGRLSVSPIDPLGDGHGNVELHGRRGPNRVHVATREWSARSTSVVFEAVPETFDGYTVLVYGPRREPKVVELDSPHPAHVHVALDVAAPRRLIVPGAHGRPLDATVEASVIQGVSVSERVKLDADGTAILSTIGSVPRVRVDIGARIETTGRRLALACATIDTAAGSDLVIPLSLVDVDVHVPVGETGKRRALAFEFRPEPADSIQNPCPYGNSMGALRSTRMQLDTTGPHRIVVPRGMLEVTVHDLASGAADAHRVDVMEDREWFVPELSVPIEVELVLLRGGAPLVGRRFMVDRPGDDPRTRYGITDERGRARLAFARSGPTRLVVAGDENRVKGSTHTIDIPALGETIVVDVPAPARIEILFGHPAQVHARPLGGLPEFYVGTATLPMHSSVDVVLGANATLALSAGEWDLRIVTADGTTVRRRVELTAGAWERIAPE